MPLQISVESNAAELYPGNDFKGSSNQVYLKIKSTLDVPLLVSWVLSWIHC